MQRPMLDPWLGVIDQILIEDRSQPKSGVTKAKRIFDRLKNETPSEAATRS